MAGIQKSEAKRTLRITKSLDDTIRERLQVNAEFRKALLGQSVGCIVAGDIDTGKSLLRKYINGTIGFIALGEALGKSSKTLMQMLGPKGNPQIRNFFEIVAYLQKVEGAVLEVVERSAA